MGLGDRIRRIFRRKPKIDIPTYTPQPKKEPVSITEQFKPQTDDARRIDMDNVRAKLDLILTELDNIKTQNQMINERLKNLEKGVERPIRYI